MTAPSPHRTLSDAQLIDLKEFIVRGDLGVKQSVQLWLIDLNSAATAI